MLGILPRQDGVAALGSFARSAFAAGISRAGTGRIEDHRTCAINYLQRDTELLLLTSSIVILK